MHSLDLQDSPVQRAGRATLIWAADWRRLLQAAAALLVLALSPSSYGGANRSAMARHLVVGAALNLAGFCTLVALLALMLTRIVVGTASGLGLSQFSIEMLVRVLVLELIPLAAALFVALRLALPKGGELVALRGSADGGRPDLAFLQREVLPRSLACAVQLLLLVTASGLVAAALAYVAVHSGSTAGIAGFNRTVGRTLAPATATVFVLKTVVFAAVVSLVPLAAALRRRGAGTELGALTRLFSLLLLIQIAALAGIYA
ncbi:MAG: ABC transporter permease [Burkholderiales bacterium]|jgi:phospholipid/cholesterol/gamma-HCH transport system permease protein|nr:ABC transporter permease [Burkholderiales bacterium]